MLATTSMRRLTRASAVALGLALALAGCGSSSPAPAASTPAASVPPTQSTTPSATASATPSAGPADLVAKVGLVTADLSSGFVVKLIPGGDKVAGQVTLDYCGYHYASEAHRVARRQVEILTTAGDDVGASNEVVVYDTPQAAAKALAELRAAVVHCPKHVYRKSVVAGEPAIRVDASTLSTSAEVPVQDNAVAKSTVAVKGTAGLFYGIEIFQLQGTVLDAVYLNVPDKPTAADMAGLLQLAQVTGERLVGTATV